jgi:hypothetical protein
MPLQDRQRNNDAFGFDRVGQDAVRVDATLLLVFTLRKEPGQFEVTIGAPIQLKEGADGESITRRRCKPIPDMVIPYLLSDPGQWRGRRYVRPTERGYAGRA